MRLNDSALAARGGTLLISVLLLTSLGGPAWATFPGGNGNLVVHGHDGGDYELWTTFSATGFQNLTANGDHEYDPEWDATGTTLAAECQVGTDAPQICTYEPDGDLIDTITNTVDGARDPAWKPNGEVIIFVGFDGNDNEIYKVDADGSVPVPITSTDRNETAPQWSPTGKWIVFRRFVGGAYKLFRIRPNGEDQRLIVHRDSGEPSWSPDGKWIAFNSYVAGSDQHDIFKVRSDGTDLRRVTRSKNIIELSVAWSPNGRKIAYIDDTGDIVKLTLATRDRVSDTSPEQNLGQPTWQPLVP